MICFVTGVAAAGTQKFVAPSDLTFLGGKLLNKACSVLVSAIDIALFDTTPGALDRRYFYALGPNAYGRDDLKIPMPAGETWYLAFSAAGAVVLYFDEGIS